MAPICEVQKRAVPKILVSVPSAEGGASNRLNRRVTRVRFKSGRQSDLANKIDTSGRYYNNAVDIT